ncbi:hypothetical protein PR048_010891 [Dryococelus australis]|uniref:Neuropeptide F n=1 Tax=Dryococelus australis TaxID=614101 RepID=A0ABQ9I3Z1_9NEOP|nr:hypothetical protein PR048_010891 [Dryococelus australis]
MQRRGKREISEKTRRPVALSGMTPTYPVWNETRMKGHVCWMLALCLVLSLAGRQALARPSPDPDQLAVMADALKYLQELDRYYSQVARPSSGWQSCPQLFGVVAMQWLDYSPPTTGNGFDSQAGSLPDLHTWGLC